MKYLSGFLLLIPVCSFVNGQTLTYDFSKGTFENGDLIENGKIKPLHTGGFAVIKIKNVNTFRYNVEIEGKSIEYITQVPSELQAIFRST